VVHALQGAWLRVEGAAVGRDGTEYPSTIRESLLLFSGDHYSMNWAGGTEAPVPSATPFRPTDEEKLARFGVLLVNAGTFEVEGEVLTIHPTFALVPEFVNGLGELRFELKGDELLLDWYRIDAADGSPDPYVEAGVRFVSRWERVGRSDSPGAP